MEKMKYESPKFEFQEIHLLERVAATCWGSSYVWVDADTVPGCETRYEISTGNGCQGNSVTDLQKRYDDLIAAHPILKDRIDYANIATTLSTNVKGSEFIQPATGKS